MSVLLDMTVQPLLVGVMVFLTDVFYHEYLPESPHVWIDVALHMVSKFISTGVTVEFIVPMTGEIGRLADPALHGLMSGLVKEQFLDTDNLSALSLVESGLNGKIPQPQYYTFGQGFLEGLTYGGISSVVGYGIDSIF